MPTTPRNELMTVRLPAELKVELARLARAEHRSLSNLVVYLLAKALQRASRGEMKDAAKLSRRRAVTGKPRKASK